MIPREMLAAYLDDALGDAETAQVEQMLRRNETLRRQLRGLLQERDRGEHSVGAIWRRQRLSCPDREQLGSYLLGVLEPAQQDYVEFHLRTIGCAFCQANMADLQAQQHESEPRVQDRRKRVFDSSAGLLKKK
jgi:anti-sigma factor RsiW